MIESIFNKFTDIMQAALLKMSPSKTFPFYRFYMNTYTCFGILHFTFKKLFP